MRSLRHMVVLAALILGPLAAPGQSQSLERSIFPHTRSEQTAAPAGVQVPHPKSRTDAAGPVAAAPAVAAASVIAGFGGTRPKPRPAGVVEVEPPPRVQTTPGALRLTATRPKARPAGLAVQLASASARPATEAAPAPAKKPKATKKGSVCGDASIRGEVLAPIASKTKGCGISDPVRVIAIDGVQFSQPATIDCATAVALKNWIAKGMRPAFGNREVVGLHIFGSYMCRSRNNLRGAKISEHGRGKAVDVAGFVFSDGREWTVARDYNKQIRKAQKSACGIFGTTLGPGSDGYHEDHLHFDTASYRNGPYCH